MFATARRLCPRPGKLYGAGEQVESASRELYKILEQHGPITATECWSHASQMENHVLKSKQHLKMMLRWMRERKTVNVVCEHKGDKKSSSPSDRKFLFSVAPRKVAQEETVTAAPPV